MPRRRLDGVEKKAKAEGVSGPRKAAHARADATEVVKRKQLMMHLLVSGRTEDEVRVEMLQQFPDLSDQLERRLRRESLEALEVMSKESIIMEKAKTMRRLHGEIAAARKKDQYSAVASLEMVLARVSGTLQPIMVNHNHGVAPRFRDAIERTLASLGANHMTQLLAGHDIPLGSHEGVIETFGESVASETRTTNGHSNGHSNGSGNGNGSS